MKRIIIFDFNRTIYDPDSKALVPNVKEVLRILRRKGFELFMITHEEGTRKGIIEDLGIKRYFTSILFTPDKTEKDFLKILEGRVVDRERSFVIGDRVRKEIAIGNMLGFQTIWCRWGKFQDEMPQQQQEYPNYTVRELKEIMGLA